MDDDFLFVCLQLQTGLPLEILRGAMAERLSADDLAGVLDTAIDKAAYDGDWQGLVRLRECLRYWMIEAEEALKQIADTGPYRDKMG